MQLNRSGLLRMTFAAGIAVIVIAATSATALGQCKGGGSATTVTAQGSGTSGVGSSAGSQTNDHASFKQARADLQALRETARTQIRALLTDQQQAQFDSLNILKGPQGHGFGMGMGAGEGHSGEAQTSNRAGRFLDRMTQELNLTDAQRTSIETIFQSSTAAKQALHEKARSAFEALVTPGQTTLTGQATQVTTQGFGAGGSPASANAGGAAALQLTPEQKTQADAIFQQLHADLSKIRSETQQQIRAVLTPEQQAQFDARHSAANGPNATTAQGAIDQPSTSTPIPTNDVPAGLQGTNTQGASGHHRHDAGEPLNRLTAQLNLTDEQRASVKTILDNLHAAIQSRLQQAHASVPSMTAPVGTTGQSAAP